MNELIISVTKKWVKLPFLSLYGEFILFQSLQLRLCLTAEWLTHTHRGKEVLSLLEEFANWLVLQKSKMASNQKWKKVEKIGNSLSYVGYYSPPWKSRMPCDHKMVQNQYLNATTSLSISSRCLVSVSFFWDMHISSRPQNMKQQARVFHSSRKWRPQS